MIRSSQLISSLHHQDYRQCLLINLSDDSFDEVTLASVGYQCIDVGWVSPGSKSQTPSIPHVFEICYQLQAFLSSNPANLAMILCSNGKTRTGIVIACYLKYSTMCDSSMDGFNLFCERRCSSMSSKKSISQSIPPSLKQFFRNFDDCCELQGFPNPDTLGEIKGSAKESWSEATAYRPSLLANNPLLVASIFTTAHSSQF